MSCHAGRVNRKKLSGLPKIGSTAPPLACGENQTSANVVHFVDMAPPVAMAITRDTMSAMIRRTRSTGSFTG